MARCSFLLGSALASLVLAAASPATSQQAIDLDQLTTMQAAAVSALLVILPAHKSAAACVAVS